MACALRRSGGFPDVIARSRVMECGNARTPVVRALWRGHETGFDSGCSAMVRRTPRLRAGVWRCAVRVRPPAMGTAPVARPRALMNPPERGTLPLRGPLIIACELDHDR